MTQLDTKKTISFFIPKNKTYLDCQLIEDIQLSDHTFFTSSERAWIVQTYLHLKNISDSIVCSDTLLPDAINVLHCDEMLKTPSIGNYFTVSIVADRRVYLGGNIVIVQNHDQIISSEDCWMMHWPQTNILASTRAGTENTFRIGYLGLEKNSIDLKNIMKVSKHREKIEVVFRGPGEWHDYSDLDAVVSIRDFISRHSQKPPTKLVNAWRAGVVFIGGKDSAYEQIGTPGVEYYKCQSAKDLVSQVDRLIDQPELRAQMVAAGDQSAARFTDVRIAEQWLDFFETIAKPNFEYWQKRSAFGRKTFRLYRFLIYTILRIKRFVLAKVGKY